MFVQLTLTFLHMPIIKALVNCAFPWQTSSSINMNAFFRPHQRSLLLFTLVSHFNFPPSQKMQRRLLTNARKNRREIQKLLKCKYKIFDQFGHHPWAGWSNMQRRWFTNPEKAKGPLSNLGQGRFVVLFFISISLYSYLHILVFTVILFSLSLKV